MYRYLLKETVLNGCRLSASERTLRRHIPLHWHDYIELEMVVGGNGMQSLNGRKTILKRGSLSLMRLTDFHELMPEDDLKILNLSIDEHFLSENLLMNLTDRNELYFELDEKETQTVETLLMLCIEENRENTPNIEYLKHLLACILLRILHLLSAEVRCLDDTRDPMGAALLYLHMHFRENPGLAKLSDIAHYNTSHFSTTFHRHTGMTYTEYLNMLKTDYAKKLLLSTTLGITEICFECGFTSHSNFLRLFRKNTGLSPSEFRNFNTKR